MSGRVASRHLEGRLLLHDLLGLRLRRFWWRRVHIAMLFLTPIIWWSPGMVSSTACGTHGGGGPHSAWFRCTIALVEGQNMSDFPTLHYLGDISNRYQKAIQRGEVESMRSIEDELGIFSRDPGQ